MCLTSPSPPQTTEHLTRSTHPQLGCGTALPTLVLFHYALTQSLPLYFTLSDYNASVLRLVTLPNLLLTFCAALPDATSSPFSAGFPNPLHTSPTGDLDITPGLLNAFTSTLAQQSLIITLISGSWRPTELFLPLVATAPEMNTLVLASETIYSPASLESFTEALVGILECVRMGKAMVAAKRVYFGVGGSVDGFKEEAARRKAVAYEIENTGLEEELRGPGVRRCLMEVQMM